MTNYRLLLEVRTVLNNPGSILFCVTNHRLILEARTMLDTKRQTNLICLSGNYLVIISDCFNSEPLWAHV